MYNFIFPLLSFCTFLVQRWSEGCSGAVEQVHQPQALPQCHTAGGQPKVSRSSNLRVKVKELRISHHHYALLCIGRVSWKAKFLLLIMVVTETFFFFCYRAINFGPKTHSLLLCFARVEHNLGWNSLTFFLFMPFYGLVTLCSVWQRVGFGVCTSHIVWRRVCWHCFCDSSRGCDVYLMWTDFFSCSGCVEWRTVRREALRELRGSLSRRKLWVACAYVLLSASQWIARVV